jgi:acyl-CoA thioester hydrolase
MIDFSEKLISDCPVTVRRRVLWGECDPAAVVYTPRFGDYFVSARDWFFRVGLKTLDRPHPNTGGLSFPMRALSFDFRSFLEADDVFDMRVFMTEISRRTFTVTVSGCHQEGRLAFLATGTSVCFDRDQRSAVSLPDSLRESLCLYRNAQGKPDI